jgi:hypothetical protein
MYAPMCYRIFKICFVLFAAARRPFRVTFRTDADEITAATIPPGTAATDEVVKLLTLTL